MYIDEEVKIDFEVPKSLKNDFEELQKYYIANDWLSYALLYEAMENSIKCYCLTGKLTDDQGDILLSKYLW